MPRPQAARSQRASERRASGRAISGVPAFPAHRGLCASTESIHAGTAGAPVPQGLAAASRRVRRGRGRGRNGHCRDGSDRVLRSFARTRGQRSGIRCRVLELDSRGRERCACASGQRGGPLHVARSIQLDDPELPSPARRRRAVHADRDVSGIWRGRVAWRLPAARAAAERAVVHRRDQAGSNAAMPLCELRDRAEPARPDPAGVETGADRRARSQLLAATRVVAARSGSGRLVRERLLHR